MLYCVYPPQFFLRLMCYFFRNLFLFFLHLCRFVLILYSTIIFVHFVVVHEFCDELKSIRYEEKYVFTSGQRRAVINIRWSRDKP